MAISRMGAVAADGTSITIPVGHQNGDLIIIFAYNASAATAPTLVAGFTSLSNGTGTGNGMRTAYKIAASSAETSGTWTNATGLICLVYRGVATYKTPVAGSTASTGTATTATFPARTLSNPQTSWVVGLLGVVGTTTTAENVPAGMTLAVNTVGATAEYSAFDTNGVYNSNGAWPATTTNLGSSVARIGTTLEIMGDYVKENESYKSVKVQNGMSTTERIR